MSSGENKKPEDNRREERLAKQREYIQKVWEKETPDERQYRLAKRRAAYKERSQSCIGKDKDKKQEERQQLSQQETPQEKENRSVEQLTRKEAKHVQNNNS